MIFFLPVRKIKHSLGIYFLIALLITGCSGAPGNKPQKLPAGELKPNVVLIFADDLGFSDIENFGSSYIQTPNLKQMAGEGAMFTSFYATPNCSPSRAALLTGAYPQRVGIPWVVGPDGPAWTRDVNTVGLNPDEETIAELLKEIGYATACVGKWHLGHYKQHLPPNHGFDFFFGLPYSNDMWPVNDPAYPPLTLIEGLNPVDTIADLRDQARLTGLYTEKALGFIEQNQHSPFFLYLAPSMPHVPINAPESFKGTSEAGLYGDVVREIDSSVGKILEKIRSLGLDEKTLVIFTSDNGPWLVYGNHAGSAYPFREGKQTTFEGGVRVPFIARWPGKIKENSRSEAISGVIDLLPTLAEITGCRMPALPIDGQSLWPVLNGSSGAAREIQFYYQTNELQAIRKGKWKLHLPHQYQKAAAPGKDGAMGEIVIESIELSLFDLNADPGESKNLAADHPEVVEELQKLGTTFDKEMQQNIRKPAKAL